MNRSSDEYKLLKRNTESKLRKYPYYQITIEETPALKAASFEGSTSKTNRFSSSVENAVCDLDYMKGLVKSIDSVLTRLDENSKRIIETSYFRDDLLKEEVQEELMIDRNKYYRLKRNAVEKFMIVLAYY